MESNTTEGLRFLFFSDLHLHNWPDCSSVDKRGYNSRFVDGVRVLKEILENGSNSAFDFVVFGGDLFHDRSHVSTEFIRLVINTIRSYTQRGLKLFALPGNHDLSSRVPTVSTLSILTGAGVTVIEKPKQLTYQGYRLAFIPYQRNTQELHTLMLRMRRDKPDIIFMHQGVRGVQSRSGYVLSGEPLERSWLPRSSLILSGHIHECQPVSKAFSYVGSPMQLDWGDVGIDKCFFDVSYLGRRNWTITENYTVKSPRFVTLNTDDELRELQLRGNFVRFVCDTQKQLRVAKQHQQQLEAWGVRHIAPPILTVGDTAAYKNQLKTLSVDEMVDAYVDATVSGVKSKKRLKHLGKEILSRCV